MHKVRSSMRHWHPKWAIDPPHPQHLVIAGTERTAVKGYGGDFCDKYLRTQRGAKEQ